MRKKRSDHGRGTALTGRPGAAGVQIKGRLWLEKDGDTYLSWGRVVLLGGRLHCRSRSLDMAYSHAWSLVAAMNRLAAGNWWAAAQPSGRPGLAHPGGRGGGDQVLAPGGYVRGWLASRHDSEKLVFFGAGYSF